MRTAIDIKYRQRDVADPGGLLVGATPASEHVGEDGGAGTEAARCHRGCRGLPSSRRDPPERRVVVGPDDNDVKERGENADIRRPLLVDAAQELAPTMQRCRRSSTSEHLHRGRGDGSRSALHARRAGGLRIHRLTIRPERRADHCACPIRSSITARAS
jgi:hypothetical protein